ncbi:hypothetical protein CFBP2044_06050 [Xanthomonas hortorum pv. cynarae]|nr:hypothetical protein CFBP2044_06050 [Xanthomonas hortorum pv. cynarae]CAD0304993.1 hypothetical protein CFBP2044_06050 [Xanthomonas hortorum pv. cynarae]
MALPASIAAPGSLVAGRRVDRRDNALHVGMQTRSGARAVINGPGKYSANYSACNRSAQACPGIHGHLVWHALSSSVTRKCHQAADPGRFNCEMIIPQRNMSFVVRMKCVCCWACLRLPEDSVVRAATTTLETRPGSGKQPSQLKQRCGDEVVKLVGRGPIDAHGITPGPSAGHFPFSSASCCTRWCSCRRNWPAFSAAAAPAPRCLPDDAACSKS